MFFLSEDIDNNGDIYIPPVPAGLRNNCKEGNWLFSDRILANRESDWLIMGFCPFFGDLGKKHQDKHWGQIWIYPLTEGIPKMLFVSYLKTFGYQSFRDEYNLLKAENKIATQQVWHATFISTANEHGDFYKLAWKPTDAAPEIIELSQKVEAAMKANLERLIDLEGTKEMVNLFGLKPEEKQAAIAQFKAKKAQALAPQNQPQNAQQLAPANPF